MRARLRVLYSPAVCHKLDSYCGTVPVSTENHPNSHFPVDNLQHFLSSTNFKLSNILKSTTDFPLVAEEITQGGKILGPKIFEFFRLPFRCPRRCVLTGK